ncbi:hypothetical protein, partial [Staphylococcus epidermidis]|uniref:hypothetical protein n=1 Tax=Staphylococcus epidermidis TaxID=1282 RepID=UPI0011A6E2D9
MVKGVVLNDKWEGNSDFKGNSNLVCNGKEKLNDGNWFDSKDLKVKENNGGVSVNLGGNIVKNYKDMYIETDV